MFHEGEKFCLVIASESILLKPVKYFFEKVSFKKKLFNFSKVVFDDEEAEIYFCFSFEKKGVEG